MVSAPSATALQQRMLQTVLLFNPSTSSINLGDEIIARSAKEELKPLTEGRWTMEISTHLPLSWNFMRSIRQAEWKFVLGSNLLRGRMNGLWRQWDLTPKSAPLARGVILMGVGWWQYNDLPNRYTSALYRYTLNRDFQHSVRDSHTLAMLRDAGVRNVLLTGCPSLWKLTPNHCEQIPAEPGSSVVTTVTDYHRDPKADRDMLMTLLAAYDRVLLWPQGRGDVGYIASLNLDTPVELLMPTLEAFDDVMLEPETDYWGTRLHAGIRAMQHGKRSMIVAIDNRATEMRRSVGLPIRQRGDQTAVHDWRESDAAVDLRLPWDTIDAWKAQF